MHPPVDDKTIIFTTNAATTSWRRSGQVGIIPLLGSADFTESVNSYLLQADGIPGNQTRYRFDLSGIHPSGLSYPHQNYRFSSGEESVILDTVRGHDVFIITDVVNFSVTYKICSVWSIT